MTLFSLRTSRVSKLHVPAVVFPECVSKPTLPSVFGQIFLSSICVLLCPFQFFSQLGLPRQASWMLSFSQISQVKDSYSVVLWPGHLVPYLSLCLLLAPWPIGEPLPASSKVSPLKQFESSSVSGIWPCVFLGTNIRHSSSSHKNNFMSLVPQLHFLCSIKQCILWAMYLQNFVPY